MIAALATTLFFAVTPVFANRSAGWLGSSRANFWRLAIAAVVLGTWAHLAGSGLGGGALGWFVFGGIIGFGVGGLAMFQSLPRLGSNLANLIVQCGSAVAAAAIEWVWLGTRLTATQLTFAGLTVVGIGIGLWSCGTAKNDSSGRRAAPSGNAKPSIAWKAGLAWAFLSALAQGAGAVVSRKAFGVVAHLHQAIDPGTAAYQRAIGGVVVAAAALALVAIRRLEPTRNAKSSVPWVLGNALTGPILGVTCFQWALRTTPAGIVQPIVAAAPLLTVPFAAWIESSRPRANYYFGAVLAIVGVSGLLVVR